MDYEDILPNLASLSLILQSPVVGHFDSQTISKVFSKLAISQDASLFTTSTAKLQEFPIPLVKRYPPQAFSVKRISGDLDRLYKMGCLKRKWDTRWFRARNGKQFGRGYHYFYSLSKRGWNYAIYLGDNHGVPREERKRNRNKKYLYKGELILNTLVRSRAASHFIHAMIGEENEKIPKEGIYRRFPVQFDEDLLVKYIIEKVENAKTKDQLNHAISEADEVKFTVKKYEKLHEIEEKLTPVQRLIISMNEFEKSNINPQIYSRGVPNLTHIDVKNIPSMRLSDILSWVIKELIQMGFK